MMANILTAHLLLGQDAGCRGYLTAYREGRLDLDPAAPPLPRAKTGARLG
jgi:hypothetical protein